MPSFLASTFDHDPACESVIGEIGESRVSWSLLPCGSRLGETIESLPLFSDWSAFAVLASECRLRASKLVRLGLRLGILGGGLSASVVGTGGGRVTSDFDPRLVLLRRPWFAPATVAIAPVAAKGAAEPSKPSCRSLAWGVGGMFDVSS